MTEKKGFNRRDFFKIIGAGSAVAATGCAEELPEKLVPYVSQPDEVISGVANWYVTNCGQCSVGCGLTVRTREGRALIVEGNDNHPINKGAVCSRGISSVQVLYDPDRIKEPLVRKDGKGFETTNLDDVYVAIKEQFDLMPSGKKAFLVTRNTTGLNSELLSKLNDFQVVKYSTEEEDNYSQAVERAFGSKSQVNYSVADADYILSVGTDFLESWGSVVENTAGWAKNRGKVKNPSTMVYVGPRLSRTAGNADLFVKSSVDDQHNLLLAILGRLKSKATGAVARAISGVDGAAAEEACGIPVEKIEKLVAGLTAASRPLVLAAGPALSADTTYLSFLLNAVLKQVGKTVLVSSAPSTEARTISYSEFQEQASDAGMVAFLDVNPVFERSGGSKLKKSLSKVRTLVYLGLHLDETAAYCTHVVPMSHFLESWGDKEPRAGLFEIVQPAMQPLYETTVSETQFLMGLLGKVQGQSVSDELELLKAAWKPRLRSMSWVDLLQTGFVEQKELAKNKPVVATESVNSSVISSAEIKAISFKTSLSDGKQANCSWMQEIPDTMTTSVWGSWIEMHPSLAEKNGLSRGDIAQITTGVGAINAPVYVSEYINPGTVALPLGYGHTSFGRYANNVGVNAIDLMNEGVFVASVQRIAKNSLFDSKLVTTQGTDTQLGRHLLKYKDSKKEHAEKHGDHGKDEHHGGHHVYGHFVDGERIDMYDQMPHVQYHWGMNVDLSKCTGCSDCVTACYAENNIPTVGKDLCDEGREMSWLRMDRYFVDQYSDDPSRAEEQPVEGFMPMMCQHCSNAPCEPVCPVYATYHNDEGLNVMVYNRCVGTRYCSNNCSYKVRRFNWFRYWWPEPLTWQLNPDVTVREVGIMEKCSFCIQRIRDGKNTAKNEGREVRDGEVQTACASVCAAGAITFGNLNDKSSEVYKKSKSKLSYKVLDDHLNTQPAVTYMKRVRNNEAI